MAKAKKSKVKEVKKEAVKEEVPQIQEEVEDKSGFLSEITKKIGEAKEISDLESLNQRVYDIWGDNVPNEIQVLASEKGEELAEKSNSEAKVIEQENETPSGWVKCSEKEMKEAEKAGTLIGWDEDRGLALIKKV